MATPVWPHNLNSLADRGSWSFRPKTDNARTDFDQGPARTRRRFTRSTVNLEFTVTMDYIEFESFKSFVDLDLRGATAWFNMPVFVGSEYGEALVRFTDPNEPYQASEMGFNTIVVGMRVETRGNTVTLSPGSAWWIGEWGEEAVIDFSDKLQILVNVDYPNIWS